MKNTTLGRTKKERSTHVKATPMIKMASCVFPSWGIGRKREENVKGQTFARGLGSPEDK